MNLNENLNNHTRKEDSQLNPWTHDEDRRE